MKISEALRVLRAIKKEVGDVELIVCTLVDGAFYNEWGRSIDLVGIPKDDGSYEDVAAIMNFDQSEIESE